MNYSETKVAVAGNLDIQNLYFCIFCKYQTGIYFVYFHYIIFAYVTSAYLRYHNFHVIFYGFIYNVWIYFMVLFYSNHDDVYKTGQKVMDEVGEVTILVNNAAVVIGRKLLDCPDQEIEKTFDVNLLAQFWVHWLLILHKNMFGKKRSCMKK